MIFHVLTIFPEFFEGPFAYGVVKRARDANKHLSEIGINAPVMRIVGVGQGGA